MSESESECVTAFDAFKKLLGNLGLQEFPCGTGTWVSEILYSSQSKSKKLYRINFQIFANCKRPFHHYLILVSHKVLQYWRPLCDTKIK